ncbi:MAG: T9SS type A sorting domain-containing protein [Lewinellaceae bacterium]|nr:T9SS type A sorting domain-containing protein [Saprospiraceae bacterium]MCB9330325.1 T9SS type A sorting domain-containing protein [Lewinellaceae bacterium]
MKTLLLSCICAAMLQTLSAQQELASTDGIPPFDPGPVSASMISLAEPAISTYTHTINDVALISLGAGFREAINLQVLTPGTDVLINEQIPAGQNRVKIDLAGMENGTYTVRINYKDKTWVKQVVKK